MRESDKNHIKNKIAVIIDGCSLEYRVYLQSVYAVINHMRDRRQAHITLFSVRGSVINAMGRFDDDCRRDRGAAKVLNFTRKDKVTVFYCIIP